MRGLFTKIFLCFWLAQSLTLVISTLLILQRHFPAPGQFQDLQDATLGTEAAAAANAFEKGGCAGLSRFAGAVHQTIYLADQPSRLACGPADPSVYGDALARTDRSEGVVATQIGSEYLWGTPVHSASGRRYLFFLSRPYQPRKGGVLRDIRIFANPQLPVAIVVFGLTTFFLVLLLTRPIDKLRAAARDLARGKLETRVAHSRRKSIFGGDEMEGLVHDFNHMAERLESLVSAQKMLLRDVSHELRSPLARLSVALELAREEAPASMTDHLQRIERETGRLNQLIGDLLRLSSMESTDAPADKSEFSLNELLEELLADAEYEAQQRSCKVEVHSTCSCIVRGNPELVYRAIENIVRNAIRYTQEGTVVQVDLSCGEQAGEPAAVLEVSDRGPGIPESEIQNIFRPFYRVDNARQRNTGGFGVGLALTERAVRLHHGDVQARNRAGGGLVVTLRIPCKQAEKAVPTPVA